LPNYLVTHFNPDQPGVAHIQPMVFTSLEAVAEYSKELDRNNAALDRENYANKEIGMPKSNKGKLVMDVRETDYSPEKDGQKLKKLDDIRMARQGSVSLSSSARSKFDMLRQAGGIAGRVALGAAGALAAGVTAAAEPDATLDSVLHETLSAANEGIISGYNQYQSGNLCQAFGETVGAVAEGAAVAATLGTATAVAVGASWSGVGIAAGVAIAGSAAVTSEAAGKLGQQAGEAACNVVSSSVAAFRENVESVVGKNLSGAMEAVQSVGQRFTSQFGIGS